MFGLAGASDRSAAVGLPKVMVSNRFLTPAEINFFRVLVTVVGNRGHVLAQVSLRQLLHLPGSNRSNRGRATWQNKVAGRSLDYLICDARTLRPVLAIELDEPTHARPERQTRDEEVETMLRAAGLPYIRLLAERGYNTREIEEAVRPHLSAAG